MIKLKNGYVVGYNKDIDIFLQSLADAIIRESISATVSGTGSGTEHIEEVVLKEIMDNCILVTHQVFEIFKTNEQLARFLTAGFLFNYTVLLFERFRKDFTDTPDTGEKGQVH